MNIEIRNAIVQYMEKVITNQDVVIAMRASGTPGILTPCFIRNKQELNNIEIGFFDLNAPAVYLSEFFQKENNLLQQKGLIYIITKPCDIKGINQMISDHQVPVEKIRLIVYACEGIADMRKLKQEIGLENDFKVIDLQEQQITATLLDGSFKTFPTNSVISNHCIHCNGHYSTGLNYHFAGDEKTWKKLLASFHESKEDPILQDLKQGKELFDQLKEELSACIRCNACRNICPACFCSDRCIFDRPKMTVGFLDKEISPEDNMLFHMIRFYHVAPNCTACGECERVCPQSIPLSHLYQHFHRLMEETFEFSAGSSESLRQALLQYRLGEDLV